MIPILVKLPNLQLLRVELKIPFNNFFQPIESDPWTNWYYDKNIENPDPESWSDLETPLWDDIFRYQFEDTDNFDEKAIFPNTQAFVEFCIGRSFFPNGLVKDNLQFALLLRGILTLETV